MTTTPHSVDARQQTGPVGPASPTPSYRLHVAGHLDDHWSDWLGGHPLVRNSDGTTTLTVEGADQAQLHGVLSGIRDLGVTLLSLHVVDPAS